MNQVPFVSVVNMSKIDLGKGAAMPLLFGGNRTAKPQQAPVAAAAAGAGAAASAARAARKEGLAAEEVAKRQQEYDRAREQVQQQIENVKTLQGAAPKQGAQEIFVNNFPINCELNTSFYQYQVTCEPDIPNRKAKKNMVERALGQLCQKYSAAAVPSNNIIFAQKPLHDTKEQDNQKKGVESVTLTMREKPVKFTFRFTRTVENGKGLSTETYGVLATVLREAFDQAGMVKIAGKYFDTSGKYSQMVTVDGAGASEGLCIASGLNITLYPTSRGLMLNVDLAMRVARKDSALSTIQAAKKFAEKVGGVDWKAVVKEQLVGCIAATTYSMNSRKQTFSIADVRFDVNPGSPIPGSATKETFAAYMKAHHNLVVSDMTQPLLLFRSQRELDRDNNPVERWYIPEFAQLVGQSAHMRGNAALQQDLKRACLLKPEERFGYICGFMGKVVANAAFQQQLQKWKMTLTASITKVPNKVLEMPAISLRGNSAQRAWQVTGVARAPTMRINQWAVISPNRMDANALNAFLGSLNSDLTKLGINLPQPQSFTYLGDRDPGRWGANLSRTLGELPETIEFVLIVLNDNNDGNYFMAKEVSLKDWNIPSQCVLQKNATTPDPRKLGNITSRIAGQIVVKLGGALWATTAPVRGADGFMVVGMSTEAGKNTQAIAMVAARASDNMPIASVAAIYNGDAAQASAIQVCLGKLVAAFKQQNKNQAPAGIIVFRPGMNEGDVPSIISKEVIPTQKFCEASKMQLVFLNSLKRCTIRFYPAPPGSLVDDFITPTTGFTFFCVPQVCNQGCATAMKFSVLSNSAPGTVTADVIEQLTFNQCHMFYGWWGATREPAVVMYSERLAEMHAKTNPKDKAWPDTGGVRVL